MRRVTYRKGAKTYLDTIIQKVINRRKMKVRNEKYRRDFFAKSEAFNIFHGLAPTIYGFGSSARWADHDEPYYCEPCATTDLSYPGSGRNSGSLNNPRWAEQCCRCGKKNPFYRKKSEVWEAECAQIIKLLPSAPTTIPGREMSPSPLPPATPPSLCDKGPVGDEGPESSLDRWSMKWLRRLGLTK